MLRVLSRTAALTLTLGLPLSSAVAQNASSGVSAPAAVPSLINYSGMLSDLNGKPQSGIKGVTFLLYQDQQGGAPLWLETQNVRADKNGRYTVTLGSSNIEGLPADVFASGQARWLAVQVAGQPEQPRVLLVAVPYAMKAADAQTLNGLPASAFALAASPSSAASSPANRDTGASIFTPPPPTSNVTTSGGTVNTLPLFTTATNIQSSAVTQSGSGTTAKIGIGTMTPATTLDVKGGATVRGTLALPATGTATSTSGRNSQPESFVASAFNSSSAAAVNQTFQWKAEPSNNNTASPSAILSFLYGSGTGIPTDTGLRIAPNGIIGFAPGQTFPNSGTVTSVAISAPSSDFAVSGSPVTGAGTLGLNWTVAPDPNATPNAIVKRDASGNFAAGQVTATAVSAANPLPTAAAVTGNSTGNEGVGVYGSSTAPNSTGVIGAATGGGLNYGVLGTGDSTAGYGAYGMGGTGIYGIGYKVAGVHGYSYYANYGVVGEANSDSNGIGVGGAGDNGGIGVYAEATNGGYAGDFAGQVVIFGDLDVHGNVSKTGGSFKIDHPLDPANKYLYHSFVESPDMMNIYNGNAMLDAKGEAIVKLPDWFESLNRDFRYVLTAIGAPGPNLYIAEKVRNNSFRIAGGQPGMEVSWQVTGIRQDAWANAHRIPVEVVKPEGEQGTYLHPELFGAGAEQSMDAKVNGRIKQQFRKFRSEAPPVTPRGLAAVSGHTQTN